MRSFVVSAIISGVFGVLSACGGTTTNANDPGINKTRPSVTYGQYETESAALHATWDAISFTDPATLPTSGSASYAGVMHLDVEKGAGEISMNGELSLRVGFANNTVLGNARSFVDQSNVAYSGKLTVSNGVLDRGADPASEFTISGDLDGRLSGAGEVLDITTDLAGDFHGPGAGAVSGVVAGSAGSSGGNGYVFGAFIAGQ